MSMYLGKRENGTYFAKSGGYEKEFSECNSMFDLYTLLRRECHFAPKMTDTDVWKEVSNNRTITPDGFVKETHDGDGNDTESINVLF